MSDSDFESENTRWLASSPNWKLHFQSGWKGQKMLGEGSYGKAGLWTFAGPSPSPPSPQPSIQSIVVKQCESQAYDNNPLSLVEGNILEMLSGIKSRHILRMYRPLVVEEHGGVEVVRLFLEYCPGGDLNTLLAPIGGTPLKPPIKEVDIWALFYCLALGISVMDRGTEDESVASWTRPEIVHYDIKPDNILMGYKDQDHKRYPILKIADFGIAIEERRMATQNDITGIGRPVAGDLSVRPPEADRRRDRQMVDHPRKGTCSNIWQVGCIIHALMTRVKKDFIISKGGLRGMVGLLIHKNETYGFDLKGRKMKNLYSKTLRKLVMECMFREPLQRPQALDLQKRVRQGLEEAMAVAEKDGTFKDGGGMPDITFQDVIWPEPPTFVEDILPPATPSPTGKSETEDDDDESPIRDARGRRTRNQQIPKIADSEEEEVDS